MSGTGPLVLVVEDEEHLRALFAFKLKSAGYEVESCGRVSQAKTLLKQHEYKLVVLDLRLEDGTGEEVIREMRSNENPNRITPILVVSGHIDTDIYESIKTQINASLAKPFDSKKFLSEVMKYCPV